MKRFFQELFQDPIPIVPVNTSVSPSAALPAVAPTSSSVRIIRMDVSKEKGPCNAGPQNNVAGF